MTDASDRLDLSQPIPGPLTSVFLRASPLPPNRLYRRADLAKLSFKTTTELEPSESLVGQQRAEGALRFGTQIEKPGFNLFVIGPSGASMREAVKALLKTQPRSAGSPSDWVYVNNFVNAEKPTAIELPSGRAPDFREAMHKLIDDLKSAIPAVFQSEDYQTRRSTIDELFQKKQAEAFSALRDKATENHIAIVRTPFGFALAPMREGKIVPPDEFNSWPEAKRKEVQEIIDKLEKELEHVLHQLPQLERERRDEIRRLSRETARFAVDQLIEEAQGAVPDVPAVVNHLQNVRADLVENVGMFEPKGEDDEPEKFESRQSLPFERYEVNVLVTQADREPGTVIVEEWHPTLGNLIGRIEYISLRGALVTNFRLIRAGALHRANGGYLLVDVRHLLMEPFSWTALKRVLHRGEIRIEDISRFLGLTSTVSLEPDPIPLNVKVILFGDRLLYFLLAELDPDTTEHFKVLADFENDIDRTSDNEMMVARLIATIAKRDALKPFDREAVGLILEHAARLAENAGKLTLLDERLRDIMAEADFWAGDGGRNVVSRADVDRALRERIYRASRLRDRSQEAILREVAFIDTSGSHVGQINGLSVVEMGGFAFGRPSRITCQVRPGSGKVVDIEREVELGGPVHSKGVLILSGFLAGRFALDTPMSVFASLVFEQSYAGVEGDSASSAELYALLSALAEAPLRQDLAVTGSVNQHGEIQAIGGVNEKIEGFFDVCSARGLTGTQGVLIPRANVQHLMLRQDVIEACAAQRFAIIPVATVDDGLALLTGRDAGERGNDGCYPAGSVNRLVEDRLRAFAKIRRSFGIEPGAVPAAG